MRLVMQAPNYLPATRYGGPIRSCHGLAKALVNKGWRVDVVTSNLDGPSLIDAPCGEAVNVEGVHVHYCSVQPPKRLYASAEMQNAFERLTPGADALQINGAFLWPGVQAARAAMRSGVPSIVTPRGMLAPELIEAKSTLIKKAWITLFERNILKRAAAIHVTSDLEAAGLRHQNLALAPLLRLPNGVTPPPLDWITDKGERVWAGIPPGKRIAFLARLDWKKGVDIAIDAAKTIPDAHLLLAGPDQIGLRARFEPELAASGLSERIRFIGALEDKDKWAFLAGSDVHIIPSLHENFGNTVIEALAVGTPALCAPDVGAGEWARQFDPDCVVPRSADGFARAINSVLSAPSRQSKIAQEAPGWVSSTFSWSAIADRFEAVIADVRTHPPCAGQACA